MEVFLLSTRRWRSNSFEHRSIIAQHSQELHPGCERGFDVSWQNGLAGVVTEATRTAQEQHRSGHAAGDDHGVVAGAAGDDTRCAAGAAGGCIRE
jgi:hypothetical protein